MAEPRKGRIGRQGRKIERRGRSVGRTRLREFEEQKGRLALENAGAERSLIGEQVYNNQALMQMLRHYNPLGVDTTVQRFGEEAVMGVLGQPGVLEGVVPTSPEYKRPGMPSTTGPLEAKMALELQKQRSPEFGSGRQGMRAAAYGTIASQAPFGVLAQEYPLPDPELPDKDKVHIPGWTGIGGTSQEAIEKAYEEGTPIREAYITSGERGDPEKLRDPKEGWELFRHRWMPWGRGSGVEGWSDPDVWSGRKDRDLTKEEQAVKNLWNTVFTTWDAFSLTMGESLINTKNLVTGNWKDIKPATIIDPQYGDTWLERVKSAKKKFDEKPFFEQLAFSLVDPFLLVGATTKAIRISAKLLPKMMVRAGLRKPTALELKKQAQEEMLKLIDRNNVKAPVLPSASEVTALSSKPRIQPKGRVGKALVGWWDPSALISSMTPGVVKATVQASLDFKKTLDITDGYVQTMMAKVETKSREDYGMSFNELFGTGPGEPKATKISTRIMPIPKTGFKPLSDEALELVKTSDIDPMDFPAPIADPGWYKPTESARRQPPGDKDVSVLTRIAREHDIKVDYTTSADDIINQLRQRHNRYLNQGDIGVHQKIDKAPMFGDVFQDYKASGGIGRYVLNSDQLGMVKFVDEMLQEYLKMLKAEGLDVKELGALDEAFSYFPRVVRDARGKEVIDASSPRPGARGSITKHRIYDYMDEKVLENGGVYGDPLDALNTYFRAGYTEIATKRRLDQIYPYAKSMLANEDILEIARIEADRTKGMRRSLRDMGHVISGLTPTAPLMASMKRLFPHLADDIVTMNAMTPYEVREITNSISPSVLSVSGITKAQFHEALQAASDSYVTTGRDRSNWNISTILPRTGINRINEAGGTAIEDLKKIWIQGQESTEEGVQALGSGAARRRNYQRVIQEEFEKLYPNGKVTVYRARRRGEPRSGLDRTGIYTNVSLRRSAAQFYGDIEVDAIEIPIDSIIAIANEQVSELIVRSGAVSGEAAAAFTKKVPVVRGRMEGRGFGRSVVFGEEEVTMNVHVGESILEDALGRLSITPGSEQVITNSAKTAVNATFKKNKSRVAAARAIRKQMEESYEKAKIVSSLANREKRMAIAAARRAGPTGAHVESLSPQLIFDRADALEMNKILEDNGVGVWKAGAEVSGALRKFRTVFDVGAPFIHGLPLLMRRPSAWATATENHYRTLFDPITGDKGLRAKYIAENSSDIVDFLKNGGVMGSSEFTETMSEGGWFAALPVRIGESTHVPNPMKPALASIPSVINRSSGHFASSFETFLDAARVETWKGLRQSVDEKDAAELASFVNKMTGTSSSRALGVPLSHQQFEAALPFFAPRYFRSISALMLDTFTGGVRGDQARKAIGSMLAGVVLIHIATQQAMGQPIRLDPTNPSEFLRTDFMGQRVGFGTKPLSLIKSFVKIVTASYKNPSGFLDWNIMEQSTYEENPILSTLRFGSAPLAANIFNVMTGADPLGREMPGFDDPVGILNVATEQVSPFWLDAALEAALGSHAMAGSIVAGGTEFTGGVTFPIPIYDTYQIELAKKAKEEWPDRTWEQVKEESATAGQDEEQGLLDKFEDLRDLKWRAKEASEKRVTRSERVKFHKEKESINTEWFNSVNAAGAQFTSTGVEKTSQSTPDTFREAIRIASTVKKAAMRRLRKNYPDVVGATESYYEQLGEHYPQLAAQTEYHDRLSSYTDEPGGVLDPETDRVDYAAIDNLREDIKEEYGDDVMSNIDAGIKSRRLKLYTSNGDTLELDSIVAEYYDSMDVLRPYWEAFKEVVPPNQWDAWRKFDAAPRDVQSALFSNPDFAGWYLEVLNKQYELLRDEPSIDMALVKFYGRTSKNKENWAKITNEAKLAEKTVIQR